MPTLERETELDCIAAALDAAADGRGCTVVIVGAAGIGKTRLIADARALAKLRGFGRMWAVGDELESAMPWAVVRQLVERSIARYGGEERQKLLAGPSGAALAALDRAPDEARAGDVALARTMHALWWVAADLASYRPVLITVDDAQWADTPSLRFLAHLAPRVGDLAIALIIATRPPSERSGPLAELVAARHGLRLSLQPLSFEAIGELVTSDGVAAAPAVLEALHAASGGNPFLAGQLIEEADARDLALDDPANADAIAGLGPATISHALLSRLPLDAVQLAATAAVLGRTSDPQLAAALARIDSERMPDAIDALVVGHVLAGGGDHRAGEELSFVHPVVREAVLAELGPGERAALHAAAAVALHEAGAAADRVAAHLAAAPTGTLPEAAALLCATAAQLLADGDAATAVRHLRRALEESSGEVSIVAQLGDALLQARDFEGARDQLRIAARAAGTLPERAEHVAKMASATLGLEGPAFAIEELRAELDTWPQEAARAPERLVLEARLATMCSYLPEEIERNATRLRAFADLPGANGAERTLLALLAQRGLYDVRPAPEVADLAARALGDGTYAAEAADGLIPWGNALNALISADGVELAQSEVEHARRRLRSGGSPFEFASVSAVAAIVGWRCGDVAGTEADAEALLAALAFADPGAPIVAMRAVAARMLVLAVLERGDIAAAAAVVARFDAACPDAPEMIPVTRLRHARAALALARDDPALAREEAFALGEQARAARIDSPTVPWRAPAAIALQRLGEEQQARALVAEQVALARRWGTASDMGASLRLNARVDGEHRLELLEQSIALLEQAPWRLELARALADYGEALRVARRRSDAHEPLRRAAELAEECGSRVLRVRAIDGLAALGDRPRKLMFSGADSLTASERRIADLASQGRSNRDIAQDLFVTPKTVENHLGRVYMKLGIKGRRELATALTA
ncbi:MAG TPA: AAA family ATPase [Solirubrobacteraceae bacterium]|nr:AAA family ATPase [Solirubrobacteraceae bacterium]